MASTGFLTIREVADELGVSERTVWRLIEEGKLAVHQFGGSTRVRRSDLDAYVERCRRERPLPNKPEDPEEADKT